MTETIQRIDFAILDFIYDHFRNPFLDKLMPFVSSLADNGIIWIVVAIVLLLVVKQRRNGITLSIALLIELIVCNLIMKPLVHRIRPYDINTSISLLINPLLDYSFPSGHTAVSFAAATVLYSINKKWGICAFILAIIIGFSRLYLYVHFPSDVLLGAIFGILFGVASIFINRLIFKKRDSHGEKAPET